MTAYTPTTAAAKLDTTPAKVRRTLRALDIKVGKGHTHTLTYTDLVAVRRALKAATAKKRTAKAADKATRHHNLKGNKAARLAA